VIGGLHCASGTARQNGAKVKTDIIIVEGAGFQLGNDISVKRTGIKVARIGDGEPGENKGRRNKYGGETHDQQRLL